MTKYKRELSLIEYFEKRNIDYKNIHSNSFNCWLNSFAPLDYKDREVLSLALHKRNNFLLFASIVKLTGNFNVHLKNLSGVKGNEYFSLLLVNEFAFKSTVINKFGFAFHLKDLLRFYRTRFLISENKPFFIKENKNES